MDELIAKLSAEIKSLHKDVRKIRQAIEDPTGDKAAARSQNNGFKKPLDVDEKLRSFIGLAEGAQISRSDVTRAIDKYAVDNNLKQGQVIHMDEKLRDLLQPPADVQVTYLKLQHYLAPHYITPAKVEKKKPAAAPVSAVTEVEVKPAVAKKPRVASAKKA